MENNSIVIIIPYFGSFPWYFKFFLESCKFNPSVNFLIISDIKYQESLPNNVKLIKKSLLELRRMISKKLNLKVNIPYPYKLCDFKPVFGYVFDEYISDFTFWGYGDLDVIYGDLRHFLTNEILQEHDTISVRKDYVTGFFQLFRNIPKINMLFKESKDYKKVFTSCQHYCFDETNFAFEPFTNNYRYNQVYTEIESMTHVIKRLGNEKEINPYFNFHAIEGRPGNLLWEKGKLYWDLTKLKNQDYQYNMPPGVYEIMLFHLISFKHVYRPKKMFKTVGDSFKIHKNKITLL